MTEFLFGSACVVLAAVALGLLRILRGPGQADRFMAAQLIGSGGVAVVLLLAHGMELPAAVDVALMLGLLAAFASVAFVHGSFDGPPDAEQSRGAE
jgi:multicomponent Na+:H+ antiporter subunit F